MRRQMVCGLMACLVGGLVSACASDPSAAPKAAKEAVTTPILVIEDAERFAALIAGGRVPDAAVLQSAYLDPGTRGVEIFTPNRIEDSANLARKFAASPEAYRHAVDVCLPVVRDLQPSASETLAAVSLALGMEGVVVNGDFPNPVPAYVVFGAGNSGGTAAADGLVMGLEVVCAGQDAAGARRLLEDFIAHEVTHSYQSQVRESESDDLLSMVLTEGMADLMVDLVLDGPRSFDVERAAYGMDHEAALWAEFQADLEAGTAGPADWMYGPGRDGRVADLGYWIGKRICAAYYAQASDKMAALQALLKLDDAKAILAASGYAGQFEPHPE